MENIDFSPANKRENYLRICPYLALALDPQTTLGYPSPDNACYHVRPVASPNLEHQQLFCLNRKHLDCPVFTHTAFGPLPPGIRIEEKKPFIINRTILSILIGSVVLIFGAIVMFWVVPRGVLSGGTKNPDLPLITLPSASSLLTDTPFSKITSVTPSLTMDMAIIESTRTLTATLSRTPTVTPTHTPTITHSPAPSETPSQTPTETPSQTPTLTPSRTRTKTLIPTATFIWPLSPTATSTPVPTAVPTISPTYVPIRTYTPTFAPLYTSTLTLAPTETP